MAVGLPEGFVLDSPGQAVSVQSNSVSAMPEPIAKVTSNALPEGFVIDTPKASSNVTTLEDKSTGNVALDFMAEVERGGLNSFAQALDMTNAANTLLKQHTALDLDNGGNMKHISDALKQNAAKLPSSDIPIVAGLGQMIGAAPLTMAEFAFSGNGVGFVAQSAVMGALSEFSKDEKATSLVKGAVIDGTIGAVFTKVPALMEGLAKVTKEFGETGGRAYIKSVANLTDKEADSIMTRIATPAKEGGYELHPSIEVPNFKEVSREEAKAIAEFKASTKASIDTEKARLEGIYDTSRDAANAAIADVKTMNERHAIDLADIRTRNIANTTEHKIGQATQFDNSIEQELANKIAENQTTHQTAKQAVQAEATATIATAQQKVAAMEEAAGKNVGVARKALEDSGLSYVPTPIVQNAIDAAISRHLGQDVYSFVRSGAAQKELGSTFKTAQGELSRDQIRQLMSSGLPASALTKDIDSLKAFMTSPKLERVGAALLKTAPGMDVKNVHDTINFVTNMRSQLVDAFKNGKTSLAAMRQQDFILENAIKKGFNGQGIDTELAAILADIKQSINPTRLYEANQGTLAHLKPLAEANSFMHSNIDNLRKATTLYGEDVSKVFKAFEKNDIKYLDQLKAADAALPQVDRILPKLEKSYRDIVALNRSETTSLSSIKKEIDITRQAKDAQFRMQKTEINQTRLERKRLADSQMAGQLDSITLAKKQALERVASANDQKLAQFKTQQEGLLKQQQDAVNERLKFLMEQDILRGTRSRGHGFANLAGNMAGYGMIRGFESGNPMAILRAMTIGKVTSPVFAASVTRNMLNAPKSVQGMMPVAQNAALRAIVTRSAGETMRNKEKSE